MNIFRLLPPIVMCLPILFGAVRADAQDAHRLSVLQAEYNVWDAAAEDITGDGVREVLLLTCDELARPLKKELLIFVGDAANQYPEAPSIRMPLPDTVSVLFFAEMDGMPPRELVAADAAGARDAMQHERTRQLGRGHDQDRHHQSWQRADEVGPGQQQDDVNWHTSRNTYG